MTKKLLSMFILSFYFYSFGKFIIIFYTLIRILYIKKISRVFLCSIQYFFIILLFFIISFFVAVLNDNDILHIVRNNFYTLIFILFGILITNEYKNNIYLFFETIIKLFGFFALIQLIIYIISLLSLEFHLFVDNVLSKEYGYSIGFAGLGIHGEGYGMKLVTNLSSVYIFLIPYLYVSKSKSVNTSLYIFILLTLVTGSLTQYGILFLYLFIYMFILLPKPKKLIKFIFSFKLFLISSILITLIVSSGLYFVIEHKVDNMFNINGSNKLTSASLRVVQAKILIEEFSNSFIFGKGLGYDSKKYHSIRNEINGDKEIKYFNYSMYENQYLDILMKFGLLGALPIYLLFFFYPMFKLFKKYLYSKNNIFIAIMVGYLGLTIFAGSNGNTFYAYSTMFIWGIIIFIIQNDKKQLLEVKI